MSRGRKGVAIRPARVSVPDISLAEIARRAGITRDQAAEIFRRELLEPTYSLDEVKHRFGCELWQVNELVKLGKKHGADLHPTRGGLFPTFKPSHKSRRVPLSAITRHEAHMARVHDGIELSA